MQGLIERIILQLVAVLAPVEFTAKLWVGIVTKGNNFSLETVVYSEMGDRHMQPNVLEQILDGSMKPMDLRLALLENITDNFSVERKICAGGFGTVYKVQFIPPVDLH